MPKRCIGAHPRGSPLRAAALLAVLTQGPAGSRPHPRASRFPSPAKRARGQRSLYISLALALAACAPSDRPTYYPERVHHPKGQLTFNNGADPRTLDPAMATGRPDVRLITELFDSLVELDPESLDPLPSMAESWEISPDGFNIVFHLRQGAFWTDGSPLDARDFLWSWQRVLDPATVSANPSPLLPIRNARLYREGRLARLRSEQSGLPAGTPVEVLGNYAFRAHEAVDIFSSPGSGLLRRLPAGTLLALSIGDTSREGYTPVRFRVSCPDLSVPSSLIGCVGDSITGWVPSKGLLPEFPLFNERFVAGPTELLATPQGAPLGTTIKPGDSLLLLRVQDSNALVRLLSSGRQGWIPSSSIVDPRGSSFRLRVQPIQEPFSDQPPLPRSESESVVVSATELESAPDLLWLRAPDRTTLEVRLQEPALGFLQKASLPPLRAVPRATVEQWGELWTNLENIVTSGPFKMLLYKVGDRIELGRNEIWWGAAGVALEKVVLYSIESYQTSVDLYRAGKTDLVVANDIPAEILPILKDKNDFHQAPALASYFYRLNTTEKPFNDPRVRRAMAMAIDREQIARLLMTGYTPSTGIVPPTFPDWPSNSGLEYDPAAARALLEEAGYPVRGDPNLTGKPYHAEKFPEFRVLFNYGENHRLVAQAVREQWFQNLGIRAEPLACDYSTWHRRTSSLHFDVSRGGWIADYRDPNAFLEQWQREAAGNRTGWSSGFFEILLAQANREPIPSRRMELLSRAETVLLDEMPIIPLFWTEWMELRRPEVKGWGANLLDVHPLRFVRLEEASGAGP